MLGTGDLLAKQLENTLRAALYTHDRSEDIGPLLKKGFQLAGDAIIRAGQ